MAPRTTQNPRIERYSDVCKRTGLSKASIRRRIKNGTFPKSINLGDRAVGFLASDIDQWIETLAVSSKAGAA